MNARQHDYGFTIRLLITEDGTTGTDISAATTTQIIFRPPRGDYKVRAATFSTDGTDGHIEYTVAKGDLHMSGPWKVHSKLIFPSGLNLRGTGVALLVEAAPE